MRFVLTAAFAALCLVCHPAPTSAAEPANPKPHFELLHLWLTDAEESALAAISDPAKAAGVVWEEHRYQSSFLGLKTEYAERLALKLAPTGTHWIGGSEMKNMVDAGVFRFIRDRPGRASFASLLLPEVYDIVRYRDGISALPLGIHIQNHFAYNSEIFASLGLAPPKTWDELIKTAKIITDAGYIGLAVSDQRWQLRFLFSSILTGLLPAGEYARLLNGREVSDEQRKSLVRAFQILQELRPYVNKDNRDLGWVDATKKLMSGQAAMAILADFSSTLFARDTKIKCQLPPQNTYVVWAFDAIALTRTDDPADVAGQNIVIDIASTPQNLANYVGRKGGVPVFKWKDTDLINPCSKQSVAEWTRAREKIHVGSAWSLSLNIIANVVQKFWRTETLEPEQVTEELVSALRLFRVSAPER